MIPGINYYQNMALKMGQGTIDFRIDRTGGLLLIKPEEKNTRQREKDLFVLSVALKMLNGQRLDTANEKRQKRLANNIVGELRKGINTPEGVEDILNGIIEAETMLLAPEDREIETRKDIASEITNELQTLLRSRRGLKKSSSEISVRELLRNSQEKLEEGDELESSSKAQNHTISRARSFSAPEMGPSLESLLNVSCSYPSQRKKKASPKIDPKSKEIKALKKEVSEFNLLGRNAFAVQVKSRMAKTLNDTKVPINFGIDIFRYLGRAGVSFSKSDVDQTNLILRAEAEEEHVMIAQQFFHLVNLLINSLPIEKLTDSDIFEKKHELKQQLVEEILVAKSSTDLQKRLQAFIERAREGKEGPELQVISTILLSLAQNAPNSIGNFLICAGKLQGINLERLPIEIILHSDVEENKLYVIYKTRLKEKNPAKMAETGDPLPFLIDSKIVFSLDLSELDAKWEYDDQRLLIGLPKNVKRAENRKAEEFFKTLTVLGLNPEYFVSPKTVPEKLSRV